MASVIKYFGGVFHKVAKTNTLSFEQKNLISRVIYSVHVHEYAVVVKVRSYWITRLEKYSINEKSDAFLAKYL
jgi:hypothetical protein